MNPQQQQPGTSSTNGASGVGGTTTTPQQRQRRLDPPEEIRPPPPPSRVVDSNHNTSRTTSTSGNGTTRRQQQQQRGTPRRPQMLMRNNKATSWFSRATSFFNGWSRLELLLFGNIFLLCAVLFVCHLNSSTSSGSTSYHGLLATTTTTTGNKAGAGERNFYEIAKRTFTDKVMGPDHMAKCLADPIKGCHPPTKPAVNKFCRTVHGHFYHTMYQKWLGPMSTDTTAPFQFLEIGFFRGSGYQAFTQFMPKAEAHSIELSCADHFPGKNKSPAMTNRTLYDDLRRRNLLHCGDATNYDFLHKTWQKHMNRKDAPPLKVVVDDGSHFSSHMAASVFYWFPKIEPRGVMIVEDIEPIKTANEFRTQFLPQLLKDLHYCGHSDIINKNFISNDVTCFQTIQPLLASIHCEMHICVLERNDEPALNSLDRTKSQSPVTAFDYSKCVPPKDWNESMLV